MKSDAICKIPGCSKIIQSIKMQLCRKHYKQILYTGKIYHTRKEMNSYFFQNGLCYGRLYNKKGELIPTIFVVDEFDYELIKDLKWGKQGIGIDRRLFNRKVGYLHRYLLNAEKDELVLFKNNNFYDNRRCNLYIENRSNKCK